MPTIHQNYHSTKHHVSLRPYLCNQCNRKNKQKLYLNYQTTNDTARACSNAFVTQPLDYKSPMPQVYVVSALNPRRHLTGQSFSTFPKPDRPKPTSLEPAASFKRSRFRNKQIRRLTQVDLLNSFS